MGFLLLLRFFPCQGHSIKLHTQVSSSYWKNKRAKLGNHPPKNKYSFGNRWGGGNWVEKCFYFHRL